ncbi:ABC transporter ATP-binding protein [Rhodanobacter sp. C01]|uniref:ABC transporter ATP-binding protein n=1 Tax=Rhodanobacter sp. C01 TaxID=1945856 RepID=UPI000984996E|nr:ABC transporter ATP-binding protein [Rhodanobacter sp. C01]OOG51066.1 ABC transporter ATP-binding protein [Rhodanobacter sp. C01]
MSSEPLIEVRDLYKSFPVYDKPHHRLFQMLSRHKRQRWYREFEALRGIDFCIERGETVGIVGRNGSGKSTLLQIICGTLAPSRGEVQVRGRVAALLELGAGFNPEFTGRENVFMNGTVLGLTHAAIADRLEEILAFANIGDFIDRPVKTYSSGMYVRLAFAVAIHVEPDLLVVDEALSVGDEAFQRKCFARIERLRQSGCTILFVSHAASTVIELCDRAILLDGGEMLADGTPKAVISRYQRMLYAPEDRVQELREQMRREKNLPRQVEEPVAQDASPAVAEEAVIDASMTAHAAYMDAYFDEHLRSDNELTYTSQGARIEDPHIMTMAGKRVNVLNAGERYIYAYAVQFVRGVPCVRFGMLIKTLTGVELAGAVSARTEQTIIWVEQGAQFKVSFEFDCRLAPGAYFMNAGVQGRVGEEETYLDRRIDALMFKVMPRTDRLSTGFIDLVDSVKIRLSGMKERSVENDG